MTKNGGDLTMAEDAPEGFTCPECGMTSHHPEDKKHGYCGNCHRYTGAPELEGADCD